MLGKNCLKSYLILSSVFMSVTPFVHTFYVEVSAVGHNQKLNIELDGPICMVSYGCYLTAKQFKERNIIVFVDG